MNAALESLGFPTHPTAPYRRFVGDGIVNLVRRALPPIEARDEGMVSSCVALMRAEYSRRHLVKTRPYRDIPDLLETLHRRGLKTAVLSNKPDSPTRDLVATLLDGHRFDMVRGARPDSPLKPDPSATLEMMTELASKPEQTVFVGDTDTDMKTGRRAGTLTVGVTWGFRDEDELRSSGAQHVIHRPLELLELLRGGD